MRQNSDNVARFSELKALLLPLIFLSAAAEPTYAFDLEHIGKTASSTSSFMSSNGRFVVFVGSNLIAASGEDNQVYIYDRDNDSLELVSQGVFGVGTNPDFRLPANVGQRAVTDDGRYLVIRARPLAVSPQIIVGRRWFLTVAISAQVRTNYREPFGQFGCNLVPLDVILRITVQHQ